MPMASRSTATRALALDEVLRRLDSDDEPEEELSDDGEDLFCRVLTPFQSTRHSCTHVYVCI